MTAVYEIGPFRLDAAAGLLSDGDMPTALGRRGVAVLGLLVERAPQMVARQDILDLAWPGLVVEIGNLAAQISAIRRVLAQTPDGERWIDTVPRRGYRFIGPRMEAVGRAARTGLPGPLAKGATAEWERRHLAWLRVRLVAPPGADLTRALSEVAETARRFGGQVDALSSTGLVAVFGCEPLDNAPHAAALAALEIHRAAAGLRDASSQPLNAMVAIDTGHHRVRPQGGRFETARDGGGLPWPGLDDLVAACPAGSTVVTAAALPFLRRRFVVDALVIAGQGVWQLLHHEAVSLDAAPFFGRASALATLAEAGRRAADGQVQVAGVVGDAGVGKSRLVREFVRQLQGWRVLDSGCAPYAVNTPYLPIAQLLRSYCQVQDTDRADAVRSKIAHCLPPGAGEPALLLSALSDLLGVLPATDPLRAVDPALCRRRTHDALRQFFLAAATHQPLCLVVEDLHWIDAASRDVLDGLVNGMAQARLLLLVNYRPEHQHAWGHKSSFWQLHLAALPKGDAGQLFDALFGMDPGLATLKQRLVGRGNPFYLEETQRALVETKTLLGARGDHRLQHPVEALGIPETVQAILAARVGRLPPAERRLLQVAATIGRDVPFALLQAVAGLAEEPLRRGLDVLEAAEFVYQTSLHPNLQYSFRHVLTHEVTYATVPPDRCRALHAGIVDAIEQSHPDRLTEQVERLAQHAVRGERWEAAVHYLQQAGSKAMENSANRDAAEFFDQALVALKSCPPWPDWLQRSVDLRFALMTALIPLGAFERILACLRDAEAEVGALDDPHRLGQLNMHMCQMLNLSGRSVEAVAFGEKAQAVIAPLGDRTLHVTGSLFLGIACFSLFDYRRSEQLFLRVLDWVGGQRQRFGLAGYPAASARGYLTRIASDQGRFAQGLRFAQEGIDLAEALNHPYSQCMVYWHMADLHVCQGELAQAVALLKHALEVARQWNQTLYVAANAGLMGHALALLGRADEGLPMMEQALHSLEAMRHGFALSLLLVPMGETYALAGRPDAARSTALRAMTLARDRGHRGGEAGALRLLGDIATQGGQALEAEQHYGGALALAEELELRPLEAHCRAGLARLHRRTGRPDTARQHLAHATAMYRDMGMQHWL